MDTINLDTSRRIHAFMRDTSLGNLPADVVQHARRCLLDLLGVAASSTKTDVTRILRGFALANMCAAGEGVRLMFDGRRVSAPAAALVGAGMIDSFDAHDGHVLVKGHVGVAVLPVLLALADQQLIADGEDFLASLVVGYEIGTRAGMSLHADAPQLHSSGAWNALAAATVGARALRLDAERYRHALGIAEYYAPRSELMRVIDHPTMVKDGSSWGAWAGLGAAFLAHDGYTGAPALLAEDTAKQQLWDDLGVRWRILEQYFKPDPICRWAQPAIEGVRLLKREHGVLAAEVERVQVRTFTEAYRLACRAPTESDAAQYSLPFSVAVALCHETIVADRIVGAGLRDREVLRIATGMVLEDAPEFSAKFPAERWAQVTIELRDGRRLAAPPTIARGNPENPLSPQEIEDKYYALSESVLGAARARQLRTLTRELGDSDARRLPEFLDAVLQPVDLAASTSH